MATKKTGKGPGPAPLDPKVVKKLLDLLSTDNEFRRLFKKDVHAALTKAGHKPISPPSGKAMAASTIRSPGSCLTVDRIASKSAIMAARTQLEGELSIPLTFLSPAGLLGPTSSMRRRK